MESETTEYWLITVRYAHTFCTYPVEGTLINHLLETKNQPIFWAKEISKEEFDQLDGKEVYGDD